MTPDSSELPTVLFSFGNLFILLPICMEDANVHPWCVKCDRYDPIVCTAFYCQHKMTDLLPTGSVEMGTLPI